MKMIVLHLTRKKCRYSILKSVIFSDGVVERVSLLLLVSDSLYTHNIIKWFSNERPLVTCVRPQRTCDVLKITKDLTKNVVLDILTKRDMFVTGMAIKMHNTLGKSSLDTIMSIRGCLCKSVVRVRLKEAGNDCGETSDDVAGILQGTSTLTLHPRKHLRRIPTY